MLNAIVSLYDKEKIGYLGQVLQKQGFNIYATKGTLRSLAKVGIKAFPIEDITKNPSGYQNYVSSLSFNTLMGVLDDGKMPYNPWLISINVVVYNFVPTWEIISSERQFNIENVDLGGPTMIRAAAINYKNVIPLVYPSQYELLEKYEMIDNKTRLLLAKTALEYCSIYDKKLSEYLQFIVDKKSKDGL